MDRELIHSLLYLSQSFESHHPELKKELENELALFERLLPQLEQSLALPEPAVFTAAPVASSVKLKSEPAVAASAPIQRPQTPSPTMQYRRSFFNSRIIKGQPEV